MSELSENPNIFIISTFCLDELYLSRWPWNKHLKNNIDVINLPIQLSTLPLIFQFIGIIFQVIII